MIRLSREIYERETVLKAAFAFTDKAYFHLDVDQSYYIVNIYPKDNTEPGCTEEQYENEVIAQQARRLIAKDTKTIREIIIGRALASTIIDTADQEEHTGQDYKAADILKDWFTNND